MKLSDSAKNWIMAIGLLLFAGVASGAWLYFSSQDSSDRSSTDVPRAEPLPVIIQVEDYVLGSDLLQIGPVSDFNGTEINQRMVILVAFALVTALVVGFGLLITLLSWITSRQVTTVVSDEGYLEATTTLSNTEKERLKERREIQPTSDLPGADQRAKSGWFATSLLFILLVWISGLILSVTFLADVSWNIFGQEVSAALLVNLLLITTASVLLYAVARNREPADLTHSESDNYPINWGTIWILVTGLIIVGVGTGLAIAMRSIG